MFIKLKHFFLANYKKNFDRWQKNVWKNSLIRKTESRREWREQPGHKRKSRKRRRRLWERRGSGAGAARGGRGRVRKVGGVDGSGGNAIKETCCWQTNWPINQKTNWPINWPTNWWINFIELPSATKDWVECVCYYLYPFSIWHNVRWKWNHVAPMD